MKRVEVFATRAMQHVACWEWVGLNGDSLPQAEGGGVGWEAKVYIINDVNGVEQSSAGRV